MAGANEFRIVTHWQVTASIEEVAAILTDPARFPDWWGQVYLGVDVLEDGDTDGIGARAAVHSKGWLPYRLNWVGTLTESHRPQGWRISATGDLTGTGLWTLTQRGAIADITYDWRVLADRPLFRILSPVLAPIFAWNHRWAMARGQEGLRREVIRRRLVAPDPTSQAPGRAALAPDRPDSGA